MEIIIADYAGFCFGVKRAIELAEKTLQINKKPVYSLGPLIHNPQVVEKFEKMGLKNIEGIEDVSEGTLIIRSHGAVPEVFAEAEKKDLKLVDATCPFVKRAQRLVQDLKEKGYQVVVVGDKNHPEVIALVGWADNKAIVIKNEEEALKLPHYAKIGVVAQTTQREDNFYNVVGILRKKADDLLVYNTICHATRDRQEAARDLARRVDVVVVVGGRNSSNTRKLAEVCSGTGTVTYHIETAEELKSQWFINKRRVGVTAGASTPDWIIEEVVSKMMEFKDNLEEKIEEIEEEKQKTLQDQKESEGAVVEPAQTETGVEVPEAGSTDGGGENKQADEKEGSSEENNMQVEAHLAENLKNISRGDIVKGTVVQIKENEVLVDIGGKSEGIIPIHELSLKKVDDPNEVVNIGDEIEVQVLRVENEEGNPVLSKKRADRIRAWEMLEEAYNNGSEVEGTVIEVVKGGLLVDVGIRGFVPASLVEKGYVEDLTQYVGKTLRLKVIELDRSRNKIVLSRKAVLDEEFERMKQETWNSLEEGQVRKGIVRRITDFGAFVDLGGVDGLLHVSEISWGRVDHPSDVLKEGQEIDVKVLSINREEGKISLGLKQLQPNPWDTAEGRYPVGTIVEGKVLRIAPFGAFVEVEPGIEGLVHISQLAEEHVEKTEDVVSVGDKIPVKVLSVDSKAQRMSLSRRQALRDKERAAKKEKESSKKQESAKEEAKGREKENKVLSETDTLETGEGISKIGEIVGDILKKEDFNKS
ncbi:MAG TPA: bifunctional 4-hydroxy-3-methylbut-2-enyl diphosphate reductase/30S ribosomal protein S1 [Peptococcaceae bacterium]|nr:MAG: Hydroxymethylbutenyl pyrophosphate reductase [Clostridia bacterium 41_269]HBT20517.1 bifunctional 4-hydroxy-3-methylbut-2-enyl diphosphate reductase/30S ribosomal protein S1 [Peptococcaceae bacterium]